MFTRYTLGGKTFGAMHGKTKRFPTEIWMDFQHKSRPSVYVLCTNHFLRCSYGILLNPVLQVAYLSWIWSYKNSYMVKGLFTHLLYIFLSYIQYLIYRIQRSEISPLWRVWGCLNCYYMQIKGPNVGYKNILICVNRALKHSRCAAETTVIKC